MMQDIAHTGVQSQAWICRLCAVYPRMLQSFRLFKFSAKAVLRVRLQTETVALQYLLHNKLQQGKP